MEDINCLQIIADILNSNAFSTILASGLGFAGAIGASRILAHHEKEERRRDEIKDAALGVVRASELFTSEGQLPNYNHFESLMVAIRAAQIICPEDIKDHLQNFYSAVSQYVDGNEDPYWDTYELFLNSVRKHLRDPRFGK